MIAMLDNMIKFFTLFIAVLISSIQAVDITPVMDQGRVRPLSALNTEFDEKKLVLPDRYENYWHPLSAIDSGSIRFKYGQIEKIKEAVNNKDFETIKIYLIEEYGKIAGVNQNPNFWQLHLEAHYLRIPWVLLLIGVYICAFIIPSPSLFGAAFFLHTLILLARILILSRPPVANMMETVIYVPWISSLITLFYLRPQIIRVGSLISIVLLGILELTYRSQGLETVQAVLNSNYWLTIHVLMIVASYGVLIFCGVIGHIYIFNRSDFWNKPLLYSMYLGVALLIPGTILGGVWAAESWGRFWDWDPKEAWAFISALLYLLFIHAYRYNKIEIFGLAIGSILGLLAISFTWYGVNFLLGSGLHSYGFGEGGHIYYLFYVAAECVFICSALIISRLKNNRPMC